MFSDLGHLSVQELEALKRDPRMGEAAIDRINAEILGRGAGIARSETTRSWQSEPGVPEKEVQRRINRRLGHLGIAVYWMSQARKSGQTAGVPDLICFDPIRGLFFVEVKAEDGKQSEGQRLFQQRCELAGVPYVLGGLAEVEAFLRGDDG